MCGWVPRRPLRRRSSLPLRLGVLRACLHARPTCSGCPLVSLHPGASRCGYLVPGCRFPGCLSAFSGQGCDPGVCGSVARPQEIPQDSLPGGFPHSRRVESRMPRAGTHPGAPAAGGPAPGADGSQHPRSASDGAEILLRGGWGGGALSPIPTDTQRSSARSGDCGGSSSVRVDPRGWGSPGRCLTREPWSWGAGDRAAGRSASDGREGPPGPLDPERTVTQGRGTVGRWPTGDGASSQVRARAPGG